MKQINPIILRLLGLIILSLVSACAGKPTAEDFIILKHYQRTNAYDGVVFTAKESAIPKIAEQQNELLDLLYQFAREEQIPVLSFEEKSQADAEINISITYPNLTVTLYQKLKPSQTMTISNDQEDRHKLIVNEMLLLWHPPNSENDTRVPVPGYVLQPVSYQVDKLSFINAISQNMDEKDAVLTVGHQSWYTLPTTKPVFEWEAFPRKFDGISPEDISDLEYEFRISSLDRGKMNMFFAGDNTEYATGLTEAKYQLQKELPYCRRYMWTLRAKFKLNGFPRVTDWSGAYTLYKSMQLPPWRTRRAMNNGLAANFPQNGYFFTVTSPQHPFSGKCVYK